MVEKNKTIYLRCHSAITLIGLIFILCHGFITVILHYLWEKIVYFFYDLDGWAVVLWRKHLYLKKSYKGDGFSLGKKCHVFYWSPTWYAFRNKRRINKFLSRQSNLNQPLKHYVMHQILAKSAYLPTTELLPIVWLGLGQSLLFLASGQSTVVSQGFLFISRRPYWRPPVDWPTHATIATTAWLITKVQFRYSVMEMGFFYGCAVCHL